MSGTSAPAAAAGEKPHAVCVPLTAQGHVTPMMKLAKILHHRGFHVTFVNSEYNRRRILRSRGAAAVAGLPGFRFATIPDGLPPCDADATQDVADLSYYTMTTCLPHFRALLADLNRSAPPVTCVVADGCLTFAVDAAGELGVPCTLLWTASACGALAYHNYRTFIDMGLVPLKDAEQLTNGFLDTPMDWVPGMSKHMRLRDYPSFLRTTDPGDKMLTYVLHEMEHCKDAAAIIYNTFDELEQPALDALRAGFTPSAYTVGPLSLLAERLVPAGGPLDAMGSSLWKEDTACLEWLDGREARSVVYVNYGSITVMSNQQLLEFAWGLANSGYAVRVPVGHPAGPGGRRRRRAAAGVRGGDAGQGPAGELVPAGGRAAARGGGGVPDALRVELHAGEPLRRGAHADVAILLRADDELAVQATGVGRGHGGGRRRPARRGAGEDKGGHGRGEGEGDEDEGGGMEGSRSASDAARGQLVRQPQPGQAHQRCAAAQEQLEA
ncbi:unnamed protein product [Urochloa humidicola]